ncbi:MAG TPA: hypothetical protein VLN45_06690 [Ignavibacteriaceae bacterium]|nr:hypothetical protein [Ignavibacteriaceae bacterium]
MKSKILSILFFLLLMFISCRQEIVPPDSSLENINEPQLTRTNSSYTFSINANRITETVIDNTFLNTFKSRVRPVISGHSSGSVEIIIQVDQNNILYSALFDDDTNGTFAELEGFQPKVIIFVFNNFTGKLKVNLTDID